MRFGDVEDTEGLDLGLPPDNLTIDRDTGRTFQAWVGAGKFDRKYLHNFFPKGTKDELAYYATQFNSLEFNATFYKRYPPERYEQWAEATPQNFKFFPKISRWISHIKWLNEIEESTEHFVSSASALGEKLGVIWLQLPDKFAPKYLDRIQKFAEDWKYDVPLAIELRHTDWFNDPVASGELYQILEAHKITNIIVDTAGRRDLLHMRLTTPTAFIRWVGCNHPVDYKRLDDWVERISQWKAQGLREVYFFVHENQEEKIPQLSAYFINALNKKTGTALVVPKVLRNI